MFSPMKCKEKKDVKMSLGDHVNGIWVTINAQEFINLTQPDDVGQHWPREK